MKRLEHGFSLAESLIAISIVSFTLLTIIGLMPAGLDNLKKAEDRAARARIVSSIVAEVEAKDWSVLTASENSYSQIMHYDRNGVATDEKLEWVYAARYRLRSPEHLPGAANESDFLRRLEVDVSDRPLAPQPFGLQPGSSLPLYEVRTAMLVDTGARYGNLREDGSP